MKITCGLFLCLGFVSFAFSQNHSGTYRRTDKTGEIDIRDTLKGRSRRIEFSVSIHGLKFGSCMGDLKGTAKFIDQNTFEYQAAHDVDEKRACDLKFIFSGNRLKIEETACDAFHGVSCEFAGSYVRKK